MPLVFKENDSEIAISQEVENLINTLLGKPLKEFDHSKDGGSVVENVSKYPGIKEKFESEHKGKYMSASERALLKQFDQFKPSQEEIQKFNALSFEDKLKVLHDNVSAKIADATKGDNKEIADKLEAARNEINTTWETKIKTEYDPKIQEFEKLKSSIKNEKELSLMRSVISKGVHRLPSKDQSEFLETQAKQALMVLKASAKITDENKIIFNGEEAERVKDGKVYGIEQFAIDYGKNNNYYDPDGNGGGGGDPYKREPDGSGGQKFEHKPIVQG